MLVLFEKILYNIIILYIWGGHMRLSKLYMPTLREDPQDAEIVSHKF